jgi:hypothetical protein
VSHPASRVFIPPPLEARHPSICDAFYEKDVIPKKDLTSRIIETQLLSTDIHCALLRLVIYSKIQEPLYSKILHSSQARKSECLPSDETRLTTAWTEMTHRCNTTCRSRGTVPNLQVTRFHNPHSIFAQIYELQLLISRA